MADGFSLNIDAKFLRDLQRIDEKYQKLMDKNNQLSKSVISAYQEMSSKGVTPYVKKLQEQKEALEAIANIKLSKGDGADMRALQDGANKAVDNINRLLNALKNIKQYQKETSTFSDASKVNALYSERIELMRRLEGYVQKGMKGELVTEQESNSISVFRQRLMNIDSEIKAIQNMKTISTDVYMALIKGEIDFTNAKNAEIQKRNAITNQFKDEEKKKNQQILDDIFKYEQDKFNESLNQYRKNKDTQASVDKHYHDKRQREYEEMFRKIDELAKRESAMRSKAYSRIQSSGDTSKQAEAAYNRLYSDKGIKSLNNMNRVLQQLQDAQNKLNLNTKEGKKQYDELSKKIQKVKEDIDKATNSNQKFGNSQSKLLNTSDQLQRKLALLFSVSAIQGYINKLIEVRGEFEMQQRSLQVLLQNKDEANALWDKTVALATKSPFRVKDLVAYTKQLAAYRVEYDKLYETNRMLADVSSGLGVDMKRLILAYGQVKAANYLRGTELRQFSEAGINILGELSKYFTEIENRAVSVADVFDRVSKRGVSFEDVDKVFKRITSERGIFYKMQEKQSETLKGQISNLHDSIDLMLNDIGKSNEGILKGAIQIMRFFVENWESIATVVVPTLEALLVGWGTYKALLAINSANSIIFFSNMQKHLKATIILLTRGNTSLRAFASMSNVTPFGAWGIVIGVVTAALTKLGVTIFEHNKAINDINKKYDELIDKTYKVSTSFMEASRSGGISEMKSKLLELVEIASNDYNMDIQVDVKGMSIEDVKNKFEELRQQILDMNAFSTLFETAFEKSKQWVVTDDIEEDFKELGQSYSNISQQMLSSRARVVAMLSQNEEELNQQQKEALNILRDNVKENETELEYVERIKKAYEKLLEVNQDVRKELLKRIKLQGTQGKRAEHELRIFNENAKKMGLSVEVWRPLFVDFNDSMREAKKEYQNFIKSISEDIKSIPEGERTVILQAAIDKMAAEKKWSEFVETTVKGWMNTEFQVNLVIRTKKAEQKLEEWQKTYNDKFGDNIITEDNNEALYGFKKIENAATKQAEVIERLQGEWGELNKTIIAVEKAGENATKKGGMYEGVNKGLLEQRKKEVELQLDAFGADYEKKRKSQGKDWMSEVVKGIKEAHQEYIKLNKTLDDSEAKQLALNKYAKSFAESAKNAGLKDISLGQFKFETEEGAIEALTFLKNKLPQSAKQARFKLEEAIGEIRGEVRIRTKAEDDKLLIEQIEDMFSGYEMSIELQKLNIPPDLAKQLFNIDALTLPELKDKVVSMESKFVGTDMEEEYRQFLKKIDEMEEKAQMERLKKYSKYLIKAQSERVKIKLEEMRQLAEIDKEDKYSQDQKETIKRSLRIETQEKLDKEAWDEFKNSEMYTQMFEDLETLGNKAIDNLLDNLENLKDSLKNLPANEVKEIMTQINKLSDIKNKRNPFASLRDAMNEVRALEEQGKTEESLQLELQAADARVKSAQNEIDAIDTILNAKREGLSLDSQSVEWQNKYGQYVGLTVDMLEEQKRELGEIVDHNQNISEQSNKGLSSYAKARNALKAVHSEWESIRNMASKAYDSIKTILESMGVEADSTAMVLADMGMSLVDLVFQAISFGVQLQIMTVQAELLGVAINSALGPIGWAVLALQAIATVFSGILGLGDAKKERRIKKEQEAVEKLQRAYEKLEKAIDNAYNINSHERYIDNAQQNLKNQIAATERMIQAEEDKKKTDKDKIKDWKNEIEDMKDALKELEEDRVKGLGGFGSESEYKSATEAFVSAWLDAYKETGDGLSGLEEQFNEFFTNMVKNQLMMRGVDRYLDGFYKQFDAMFAESSEQGGKVTKNELESLKNLWASTAPELNEFMENLIEGLGIAKDLTSGTSELSGLQRGIQSVSESTAQIIEAYMASVRFYVADSNSKLTMIANQIVGSDETTNPMLSELRSQTELIRSIRDMFGSVIKQGHSTFGGAFLKVSL